MICLIFGDNRPGGRDWVGVVGGVQHPLTGDFAPLFDLEKFRNQF